MKKLVLATLGLAAVTAAMPAAAQDRWDWSGGRAGSRDWRLDGRGVPLLAPELRGTHRGRAFVMRNFDRNRDGRINPREAEAANAAFFEFAGPRRGGFGGGSTGTGVIAAMSSRSPPPVRPQAHGIAARCATMAFARSRAARC